MTPAEVDDALASRVGTYGTTYVTMGAAN